MVMLAWCWSQTTRTLTTRADHSKSLLEAYKHITLGYARIGLFCYANIAFFLISAHYFRWNYSINRRQIRNTTIIVKRVVWKRFWCKSLVKKLGTSRVLLMINNLVYYASFHRKCLHSKYQYHDCGNTRSIVFPV